MSEKPMAGYEWLGSLYLVYMVSLAAGFESWSNVLSPVCALVCFMAMVLELRRIRQFRVSWLLAAAAALTWGLTDALWGWFVFATDLDPNEMTLFMLLYILPNIFIAGAVAVHFRERFGNWRNLQMALNAAATFAVMLTLVWILFFTHDYRLMAAWDADNLSLLLYVITDVAAIGGIAVMYLSNAVKRLERPYVCVVAGVLLYSLSDFYYTYLVLYDLYVPNTLIDGAYMGSFVLFAVAAGFEARHPILAEQAFDQMPLGASRTPLRSSALLVAPVLLVLIHGFDWLGVAVLLVIAAVHWLLSGYVQNAQRNEELLRLEIELNNRLEERITLRTMDLMQANRALDKLAKIDDVTGLYNRRYFMEALEERMETASTHEPVVVLFMDLDRFKSINDSHGHDMGDTVLKEIGARLEQWRQPDMLLARMGGDEFVLSFTGSQTRSQVLNMAEEIAEVCGRAVLVPPYRFHVSLSIGIAQYPMDALDRYTLMKHADIAMYQAKELSGSRIVFYSSQVSERVKRRHTIEMLMQRLDYDKEFSLHFQPQFGIPDRRLIGAEALLRWNSPELGMVSPGEFIPVAEETGAIVPIGEWVLTSAIRQMAHWNRVYGTQLQVGVNVSPKQMDAFNFIQSLKTALGKYQLPPQWLDIEITESSTMNSEVRMEEILTALTGLGVTVSIDDFGTGYSSLSYIKRFDIDRLKIARELVSQIETDPVDSQITQAIVMMAKGMGLRTIAEGVETEVQLNQLMALGCDEVQGYLTGRPVSAGTFEETYLMNKDHQTVGRHA